MLAEKLFYIKMINKKKIAVVIPAYNEEDFIQKTVQEIPKTVDKIVCVDDRSKDNTYFSMLSLAKKDSRIIVLQTDKNGGIGHAVRTGMARVLNNVDYVAVLPGDNQCDAGLIVEFVKMCEDQGLGCVKGNRFMNGNDTSTMPKNRKIGNIIYSFLTKIVSGYYSIFDSQHGFCVIRAEILRKTTIDPIRKDYLFDNSLWILLNSVNSRVGEMASPVRYQGEVSDVKYLKFIKSSLGYFLTAFFWRINKKYGEANPVVFMLFAGVTMLVISILYFEIWPALYAVMFFAWALFYDYWNDPNYKFLRKQAV